MLWVVPADILRGNASAERAARLLSEECGCGTWVLNDGNALAFSCSGALVQRGVALDYPSYLEQTRPIFDLLHQMTIHRPDALDLEIPDIHYWVSVLLQPEELDSRWCSYIKNRLVSWEPFSFRAVSAYRQKREIVTEMERILMHSLNHLYRSGVAGERLELGSTYFSDFYEPETPKSYPKHGFEVRC